MFVLTKSYFDSFVIDVLLIGNKEFKIINCVTLTITRNISV
jgi:hypothetical protein